MCFSVFVLFFHTISEALRFPDGLCDQARGWTVCFLSKCSAQVLIDLLSVMGCRSEQTVSAFERCYLSSRQIAEIIHEGSTLLIV